MRATTSNVNKGNAFGCVCEKIIKITRKTKNIFNNDISLNVIVYPNLAMIITQA